MLFRLPAASGRPDLTKLGTFPVHFGHAPAAFRPLPHRVPSAPSTASFACWLSVVGCRLQYEQSEVTDQMDLLRAQAKGQEFDEAKAQDKIEAQLERELVRDTPTHNEHTP